MHSLTKYYHAEPVQLLLQAPLQPPQPPLQEPEHPKPQLLLQLPLQPPLQVKPQPDGAASALMKGTLDKIAAPTTGNAAFAAFLKNSRLL